MIKKIASVPFALAAVLLLIPAVQAQPTTEEKLEALAQEVEALRRGMATTAGQGRSPVHVGGYGELHYNNLDSFNRIDFHRFVLFFGYNFTDRIRFYSELEVEHSLITADGPGEVELEQAFVDFDLTDNHTARAGLFLIPVGILNETHEPPTFYGVERNPIESNIIPTTWWEGGAALYGRFAPGLSYDLAATSGLEADPADFGIRGGRQKVANAVANDAAYTARLKWTGMRGVELAATVHYQQDLTQGAAAGGASAVLTEAHAILARGPFGLRALYAQWDIDHGDAEALGPISSAGGTSSRPSRSRRSSVFSRATTSGIFERVRVTRPTARTSRPISVSTTGRIRRSSSRPMCRISRASSITMASTSVSATCSDSSPGGRVRRRACPAMPT